MNVRGARAVVIATGLALVLVVVAIAVTIGSPSGALKVYAADNPRLNAQDWLRQNGGSTCTERPIVEYRILPSLMDSADAVANGWVTPGNDSAFVGDIALASFNGVSGSIARGPSDAWVIGKDGKGPFIAQYMPFTTPKGRTLWVKTSWERPLPEAACQS